MDDIKLDFELAKTKHIEFKSRLKAILYGVDVDETPVLSHFECGVGKWIYGNAMVKYGHIEEMHELEKVHASIHTCAKELVGLYKAGNIAEARNGFARIEEIATNLIGLLNTIEVKMQVEEGL